MEDQESSPAAGLRIPKACEACRTRKVKCNGANPCKTCQQRNLPCVYRNFARQRRKKQQERRLADNLTLPDVGTAPEYEARSGRPKNSVMYGFHNSVSATHMTSPSCKVQLYYGPTSHFSLMQHIYRDLVSAPQAAQSLPQSEVEEAGAGLDLFSFRRIFFGSPAETHDSARTLSAADAATIFLPYDIAKTFLQRYLSSIYHLTKFKSREAFERQLDQLYTANVNAHAGPNVDRLLVLLSLACGALGTEHHGWGELLFERVKASSKDLDDVVNLQTVQLSLLMAHYQSEQGRPNSSFLHLGTAARKALSAGLHKDTPSNMEDTEGRQTTFWSLYFYETWICFHLGRPSSLSLNDIGIAQPDEPFLEILIHLSKAISRSANEIYGRRHESLLEMWRTARSIMDDIQCYDARMQEGLGYGLGEPPQLGSAGVQQTMLTTLYYHTILLTFRPFLIFRGKLRQHSKNANQPPEVPAWLNEACNCTLSAAQRTMRHLCEASAVNELVRELRYHGFFFGSACFTLIYDLLQDDNAATLHLPWIHACLQCLYTVQRSDPITSTITAIRTVLKKINPAYDLAPDQQTQGDFEPQDSISISARETSGVPLYNSQANTLSPSHLRGTFPDFGPPVLLNFEHNNFQDELRNGVDVIGNSPLDFTQSDIGWDLNFSTMDLEAFLSIYPTVDQQAF